MSLLINPKKENRWRTIAEKRPEPGRLCSTCWNIENKVGDGKQISFSALNLCIRSDSNFWHRATGEIYVLIGQSDGWKYNDQRITKT